MILHQPYTRTADVHSYGMLLFELITHQQPFHPLPALRAAFEVAVEGTRPPLPPDVPDAIGSLVKSCWGAADDRPTFDEAVATLEAAYAAMGDEAVAWCDAADGHPVYDPGEGAVDDDDPAEQAQGEGRVADGAAVSPPTLPPSHVTSAPVSAAGPPSGQPGPMVVSPVASFATAPIERIGVPIELPPSASSSSAK